jgi:alkylation response protein AidB-like acyl-CoA dehydrogenase
MPIAISEEHEALAQSVRRFCEEKCPPSVPRALLDAETEEMPPFWDALSQLGWLGLHLPDRYGGSGFGLPELAVVCEQLGRAAAPGPFLPSVLAAALILEGGTDELRDAYLPGLADGSVVGAAGFGGPGAPVLGGALADVFVVPDGEGWVVADRMSGGVTVTPLPSLDPTRRVARVELAPGAGRRLAGLTDERVRALAAALVAAECAGGAAWCVETAASYAKVREQFGRPIGQFQAVKHTCANMLVALEQAVAVAWDAARAAADPAAAPLPTEAAASLAPEAFFSCAKACIQVLGGIGFTWEHDAHIYLRRATVLRQLLGAPTLARQRVARLALTGVRRELRVDLGPEAEPVRREVRAFIESIRGLDRRRQRERIVDAGYYVPHWPRPWGRDAGPVEQLVIDEEFRAAGIRRPNLGIGAWAAPTIVAHGTPEQQERWVRPTLLGDISWCQMFSEPGAGSDLASLATKAVRTEGGWLLSGQKVWTSMAREADWAICLARTNPDAPKHLGITYFVVDMRTPGIEIRPLRELTGHAMFNEIFLNDVFVPDDCVIGPVDGGWPLARTTLANERVAMSEGSSFGGGVEALLRHASELGLGGDPVVLDRLGGLLVEAQSLALMGLRTTVRALAGARPGPESSVRKLLGAEHDQRVQEYGLELCGPAGAATTGAAAQWSFGFLANRCLTIAGGTSEIQRNVIAERLLGLPRDP